MEKVTIVFADGTELEVEKNGTCFIVDEEPEFPEDLSVVEAGDRTYVNAFVIECASVDNRYWFTFGEMSEDDVWKASIEDALCELSMG